MANTSPQFKQEIQQMMYIAGETQDTSDETTTLIESIIHGQVVHMLTTANDLALRRGARLFTVADLIFQFRHDTPRVDRLRTFLTWKAIRKTVKDADDKDALAAADDEPDVDDTAGASAIKAIPAAREGLGVRVVAVAAAAREKATAEGLFGGARGEREAVAARHVRVAFQRLQCVPKKRRALLVGTRLPRREELQLVRWLSADRAGVWLT
ncbi:Hybrid signal transduction histidine kinase J [Verticillium dahliae VDG2]|nr:Hybrid signal transduction histidine kinase J [Verticillium dahliae VDG2]